MQETHTCFFMVADLHSLTTHPDTTELKKNVQRVIADNIACGGSILKKWRCIAKAIYMKPVNFIFTSICLLIKANWKTATFKDTKKAASAKY